MSLAILVISLSLFSSLTSTAIVLPTLYNASRPPPQLSNPSTIINNNNNTSSSPSNVLRIQCTANYGRNLNPSSCRAVFHYIARTEQETTLAQRHTGRPDTIPLPLRFLSNDGLCFVQPLLKVGAETARASSKEMGEAGYTLFERCVVEKGLGGIAADIGGDSNLNVVISDYSPHVRCDKSTTGAPPWESCLLILSDMATTVDRQVFGVKSQDPRVQFNIPYYLKAIDARCQLEIGIVGKSTSASWYEIWEAASAVTAMCVRAHEKGGKAFGIGLRKNIFVKMSDENPDLSSSAVDVVNVSTSAALLGFETSEE